MNSPGLLFFLEGVFAFVSYIMWAFIPSADILDPLHSDTGGLTLGFLFGIGQTINLQAFHGWFWVEDGCVWCTWLSEVTPVPIKHWSIEMPYR